jgi:hypothetical protein
MPPSLCLKQIIGPLDQNGPTFHEHVVQGPHVILGMVLHVLTHFSTHVIRNYFCIKNASPCGKPDPTPWVSTPLELHRHVGMP